MHAYRASFKKLFKKLFESFMDEATEFLRKSTADVALLPLKGGVTQVVMGRLGASPRAITLAPSSAAGYLA